VVKRISIKGAARSAIAQEKRALKGKPTLDAVTVDSFTNFAAGLGVGTDNQSSFGTYGFNPITNNRALLEWMYRGSWICQRAVDCVADDSTREGVNLTNTLDPEDIEVIESEMQRWMVWPSLNAAKKWARLYGGCIAVIMIDGHNPATPLDVNAIAPESFRGLQVLDRWMVQPSLGDIVQELGPEMGYPKFYDVVAQAPMLPRQRIHYSRVFRLEGVKQPFFQRLTLNYWGCSVFEPLYDRLLAFDSTTQGTAQLTYKAHLRTLKIPGLREIIAAGGDAYKALLQQVAIMRRMQTNEGMSIIQGGPSEKADEFEAHNYTFAGLSDVLLQFAQQLSGATGIPLVRLFGQSPAGLNATGDADIRNYYDTVKQGQELEFRNPLDRTLRVIAASKGIELPEGSTYTFRPLWQLSAKEKAETAQVVTQAVVQAKDANVLTPTAAMKELRQLSYETGIFSNITDKEIKEAEEQDPITPEMLKELTAQSGGKVVPIAQEEAA
jgi:phage-related protein (TIGR01555 family)